MRRNKKVFGQAQLVFPQYLVGNGEDFLWPLCFHVGRVALTADSKQQGVYPGRIYGVDGVESVDFAGNGRSGNFVNQRTEAGVFLWRASNHGKRPDGVFAVI